MYDKQIAIGVTVVARCCLQPVLQSSGGAEAWGFVVGTDITHWWFHIQAMYDKQLSIGVTVVAQCCLQP